MSFKTYLKDLFRRQYLNRLPKKRMGAGCLFFNSQEKILILKPTYKDNWLLPGGVIEANESPRQACIREVKEETGIDCHPTRLLCVDYVSDRPHKIESIQFVFYGGTLSNKVQINLPNREIASYQFAESTAALSMLGIHSQRRLKSCLPHLDSQITVYLENGHQP